MGIDRDYSLWVIKLTYHQSQFVTTVINLLDVLSVNAIHCFKEVSIYANCKASRTPQVFAQ